MADFVVLGRLERSCGKFSRPCPGMDSVYEVTIASSRRFRAVRASPSANAERYAISSESTSDDGV